MLTSNINTVINNYIYIVVSSHEGLTLPPTLLFGKTGIWHYSMNTAVNVIKIEKQEEVELKVKRQDVKSCYIANIEIYAAVK